MISGFRNGLCELLTNTEPGMQRSEVPGLIHVNRLVRGLRRNSIENRVVLCYTVAIRVKAMRVVTHLYFGAYFSTLKLPILSKNGTFGKIGSLWDAKKVQRYK